MNRFLFCFPRLLLATYMQAYWLLIVYHRRHVSFIKPAFARSAVCTVQPCVSVTMCTACVGGAAESGERSPAAHFLLSAWSSGFCRDSVLTEVSIWQVLFSSLNIVCVVVFMEQWLKPDAVRRRAHCLCSRGKCVLPRANQPCPTCAV